MKQSIFIAALALVACMTPSCGTKQLSLSKTASVAEAEEKSPNFSKEMILSVNRPTQILLLKHIPVSGDALGVQGIGYTFVDEIAAQTLKQVKIHKIDRNVASMQPAISFVFEGRTIVTHLPGNFVDTMVGKLIYDHFLNNSSKTLPFFDPDTEYAKAPQIDTITFIVPGADYDLENLGLFAFGFDGIPPHLRDGKNPTPRGLHNMCGDVMTNISHTIKFKLIDNGIAKGIASLTKNILPKKKITDALIEQIKASGLDTSALNMVERTLQQAQRFVETHPDDVLPLMGAIDRNYEIALSDDGLRITQQTLLCANPLEYNKLYLDFTGTAYHDVDQMGIQPFALTFATAEQSYTLMNHLLMAHGDRLSEGGDGKADYELNIERQQTLFAIDVSMHANSDQGNHSAIIADSAALAQNFSVLPQDAVYAFDPRDEEEKLHVTFKKINADQVIFEAPLEAIGIFEAE